MLDADKMTPDELRDLANKKEDAEEEKKWLAGKKAYTKKGALKHHLYYYGDMLSFIEKYLRRELDQVFNRGGCEEDLIPEPLVIEWLNSCLSPLLKDEITKALVSSSGPVLELLKGEEFLWSSKSKKWEGNQGSVVFNEEWAIKNLKNVKPIKRDK